MTPLHLSYFMTFIISMTGFMLHRTSLISTLLCLEAMMLSLFIATSVCPIQLQTTSFMLNPMLILTFSACEASLGLSLLVASSRTHNPNNLQNLNLLQC
ncbi:NADH dehydrogenase subunit 4L (mitochondrion) [Pelodiscus sinensis]|uniref:NADH-ubiquinone oxidoreductase chain 4L n=2 Tax=Pelodiscus TaxID=204969 RepID=A2BD43_PELSI|nr:NADH dehydrogenase subunit 4L [Pelodiscus sinensis]UER94108.1 NADH dehydrogenase subunit 4L [Pelodiscus maackii]AAY64444.1 NADH dehydrogenase subunit 4L [Pelodiscus sinensis]UYR45695.1 NADH dehydrogenase subunit 4L [Pelodiscus sinensis]WEU54030.1 NADH dehydrogenase subunit 4L [Pelodiscus maackii]WFF64253.1 NADH dehydrogenase subunit 4L [Pelodiscus sinensis]